MAKKTLSDMEKMEIKRIMKKAGPRSGTVVLSDMEKMALERIDALKAQLTAELQLQMRRFLAAFARAHSTPSAITVKTSPDGLTATWTETATDATKAIDPN